MRSISSLPSSSPTVRSSDVGVVSRWRRAFSSSSSSPSPETWRSAARRLGRAVAGEADEARLLVEGPADGLADPEGGVGGELEALAPVELVDGVLEAEVALLDEVEQLHAGRQRVAAGDAHDEAEVGPDEAVLGRGALAGEAAVLGGVVAGVDGGAGLHARFDRLGELALLGGGEEGHEADLVEVLTDGIAHGNLLNDWYPGHLPRGK